MTKDEGQIPMAKEQKGCLAIITEILQRSKQRICNLW